MYIEGGMLACSVLEWCLHACSTQPFLERIIGLERSRQGTSKRPPEPHSQSCERTTDIRLAVPRAGTERTTKHLESASLTH